MIVKSYKLSDVKNLKSSFFLFYGENEGQKDEAITEYFLKDFKGEVVKYDESQIIENKNNFFDTCYNESLFENSKVIIVLRVTSKSYEIVKELISKKIYNTKVIFNSKTLDKKSKIRQLFEKENDLVCIPFYLEENYSLHKIASQFFRNNKISISNENINLIIENCSGDRRNLKNEMNKILNYCLDKNKINKDEIVKLINLYERENFFELIDNCLAQNHKRVIKIINNNTYDKNDSMIIIRSFVTRIKRLILLKKNFLETQDLDKAIDGFRPPIFWKDKDIVKKQVDIWSSKDVCKLLEEVTFLEIKFKKNYELSNNLIFDFIINTSANS